MPSDYNRTADPIGFLPTSVHSSAVSAVVQPTKKQTWSPLCLLSSSSHAQCIEIMSTPPLKQIQNQPHPTISTISPNYSSRCHF